MKGNFIFWLLLCSSQINAQSPSLDKSPRSLHEVMEKVDAMYKGKEVIDGYPKYNKWTRWAYWWSSRTGKDSGFSDVNALNEKAIKADKSNSRNIERRSTTANWVENGYDRSTYGNNQTMCVGNGYFRVDRMTTHPTDPDKIYACLPYGGLWYSPNKGITWESLNDNLAAQGAAGLVVDYDDPNTLYLFSGASDDGFGSFNIGMGYYNPSSGVYKSEDHGKNWERILDFEGLGDIVPFRLKMSPLDHNLIIAATTKGFFFSKNKGKDWTHSNGGTIYDIEFHPTDENRIYLSSIQRIFYTDNKFQNLKNAMNVELCGDLSRIELAVSPDEPNSVWALAGGSVSSTTFCGVLKSSDLGENYTTLTKTPNLLLKEDSSGSDQSIYDLALAVHPLNANIALSGGLIVHGNSTLSSNPSAWTNLGTFFEANGDKGNLPDDYIHPDIHDIVISPVDGAIYVCSDGGIYVSNNVGNTWNNISEGISGAMVYNMNSTPINTNVIGLGMQDNGVKVRKSSTSTDFIHLIKGDGFDVAFDPTNANRMVALVNNQLVLWDNYNNDANPRIIGDDDPRKFFFQPIRFRIDNSGILYKGGDTMRIIGISNSGSSVSHAAPGLATWEIETCPINANLIYIAGGNQGFLNDENGSFSVSFNSGASFTNRKGNSGWPTDLVKITDIAAHSGNCLIVAFSNGGYEQGQKVYYSSTAGLQWTNKSYNLPNVPVHSVEFRSNGDLFAGTEIGVYFLSSGSTSWIPFYNNLPKVPVTDLAINKSTQKLIASTYGRGIWETPLPQSCDFNGTFTGVKRGQHFKEVGNELLVNSIIRGGEGTKIDLHAGQRIVLKTGFSTTPFSRVIARVAGCGSGVIPE